MNFNICKIKNIDSVDQSVSGVILAPSEEYTIPDSKRIKISTEDSILDRISEGKLQVGSSSEYFTGTSKQIEWLKNSDSKPLDADGSPFSRIKAAPSGWSYQMCGFEFESSKLNSIIETGYDGTEEGFTTIKFYDSNDVELTTQVEIDLSCVRTEIHWEPTFDYEMIGGELRHLTQPISDIRLWVMAVPDIPEGSGGSKLFVNGINLRYIGADDQVKADGRASKRLTYNATYHTNKLCLRFRHAAGVKHKMMMVFEFFRA